MSERSERMSRVRPLPEAIWGGGALLAIGLTAAVLASPGTTLEDFHQPGSQPFSLVEYPLVSNACQFCHGGYDEHAEPHAHWKASMMGQAARDPIFHAALAIANQDAAFAGEMCLRCHTPGGWISGRSEPPDGTGLIPEDFDGVNCSMCHRMVDPVYVPGVSPMEDWGILASLADVPQDTHSAQFVIDPFDRRRGPFQLEEMFYHQWLESPFHTESRMCATCHDVSNPLFERASNGTYVLGPVDARHPTGLKNDMFPVERTYSEWSESDFARGAIDMGGRFGGNKLEVSSCQDCHMPDVSGFGAREALGARYRDDVPAHQFAGANSWVLRAVLAQYGEASGLTEESVDASEARTRSMMERAADLEVVRPLGAFDEGTLLVRVVNQSGHKLPTGYPEGPRMWVNVRFFDGAGALIDERGAYDASEATLDGATTKVYEGKLGLDAAMSALTGKPSGPGFHFALNNVWYSDNRIPPRGFTNAGFASVQAAPVGYAYQDGQYWDGTVFAVPPGAARAEARLYHQTTTREYIEFLRDENITNGAGAVAYALWESLGKSAPVLMAMSQIDLGSCGADIDGSGEVDILDFLEFFDAFGSARPRADVNADGLIDVLDRLDFMDAFGRCVG
ncbi:MAG: hypothetical protein KF838_12295 [Phycisphaeraceae bacterium]|nr:MAG: hypothetical protein KF838_12295 [Phycisphaeraceae bacterium]